MNVVGMEGANSTEIDGETEHPVVIDMPEHVGGQMGGTMRLGRRVTVLEEGDSIVRRLYGGKGRIVERHRHRYEVNPAYVQRLETAGMRFVGKDEDGLRMEVMVVEGHPYYMATQFHPEYLSRPLNPSPPFLGLILASCGKLTSYLARGCRLSPRHHSDDEDGEFGESSGVTGAALQDRLSRISVSSEAAHAQPQQTENTTTTIPTTPGGGGGDGGRKVSD